MKPETYKAAIFRGPGHVDVVDLPYPECGDDDAIVRNLLTGICGSDIFAFQKHGPTSRIWVDEEFGHEGIAEVVELGKNVKGLKRGRPRVRQHRQGLPRQAARFGGGGILELPQDSAMRGRLQPAADRQGPAADARRCCSSPS